MSRDFDTVIVGAGVIGTVMASLLLARKLVAPGRVAIIADRLPAAEAAEWDLRVFALSRASERLLRQCGVWAALPPQRMYAYECMCVWDAGGVPRGAGSLSFDCAEIGEPNLGFIVDGGALQAQSLKVANALGAVLIEAAVDGVAMSETDARIHLSDTRELRAKLLIAADGTESPTREFLGIATAGHGYHQDALVGHVRTSQPHRGTAWQRFLATGPLAFLPMPDGRSSIVWSTSRGEAKRLKSLDSVAFGIALTEASGGALGDCELVTPIASFPLKLQYALEYALPHAVLLGDAAHAVHPLAGQGLNLGLLDCASLVDVFTHGGGAPRLGEYRQLRRYERWRRSENLLAATALDGLERMFSSVNPAVSGVRSVGLQAIAKLPFIKRQFARRALGLAGDVPEFLKVESA